MRTTLDLPAPLLQQAMELSHQRTRTAVITKALEELIRKSKIQGIRKYKGKINLSLDLDTLRGRA